MYDDTCRFLAEHFSADFASWLLGEPVTLTEIKPSELSLDPIRADALILLESDESVLHIEFQTLPKNNGPFRVLDYRVRMYRKDPTKSMRQVVIYLRQTSSELVYQTSFTMERTHHEFDVIRLWEQPASLFLQYPGLIPFAALGLKCRWRRNIASSGSKNGSDCRLRNTGEFDSRIGDLSWLKIRR
jgi:predicted transposase/invertase (TIGR01784 family)